MPRRTRKSSHSPWIWLALGLAACQASALAPIRREPAPGSRTAGQVPLQLFQHVPGTLMVRIEQATLRRSVQAFSDAASHSAVVFRLSNPARLRQDLVVAASASGGAYQATFTDLPTDDTGGYTLTASLWREVTSPGTQTDPGYADPDNLVGLGMATTSITPGEARTVALTIHALPAPILRYRGRTLDPAALTAGTSGLELDAGVNLTGNPLSREVAFETMAGASPSILASDALEVANWPQPPGTATLSFSVPVTTDASASFTTRVRLSGASGSLSVRQLTLQAVPLTIAAASPSTARAGRAVVISGTGFSPVASENVVLFGTAAASVGSASATRLETTVPVDARVGLSVAFAGASATGSFTLGPFLERVAGSGTPGLANGAALNTQFNQPLWVARDAAGALYVSEEANHVVRKISPEGQVTTFYMPVGTNTRPTGLAFDSSGSLYVAVRQSNRIDIVSPAGNWVGQMSATNPYGLCFDAQNNLYVSEYNGHRVRKFNTAGAEVAVYGTGVNSVSGDGGPASSAGLPGPAAITLDGDGNLYVAEPSHHRIRRITPQGIISTFAGTGSNASTGDGGAATLASVASPWGISADGRGNLYICESSRVREVDQGGIIRTVAGGGINGSPNGGLALEQSLLNPRTPFADGQGNVWFPEYSRHRILRLTGL